ncbi:MAG: DUF4365 domain-containing protein [Zavarzinella sp.]|nr:DUF4365 domain-containing protein [Zavarzinella sp.]
MLSEANIEAELSYAYLHAVASKAGFACEYTTRHMDSAAIDAIVREDGRFLADDSAWSCFEAHFQLKATYQRLAVVENRWSFSLPIHQYNRLRDERVGNPRFLVVLLLPDNAAEWLQHSEDGLIAKRCAYWVSLRGAAESDNERDQTVYIPRTQLLSPDGLTTLMTRLSRREVIPYGS